MRIFDSKAAVLAAAHMALRNFEIHTWTTMGFGMIRTYLDPEKRFRLNVWDDRLEVPNVSRIHNHPWDFGSLIVCGEVSNYRYKFTEGRPTHDGVEIVTGEGGGITKKLKPVRLMPEYQQIYVRGQTYNQDAHELHETDYVRGTVTINDRSEPSDAHTALVFFPLGTSWVDAEPRPARSEEIIDAVLAASELLKVAL